MSLLKVQPLVVVTGISASGKSTVADLLARRFERGVHVKGDVFRRMVVSGRHEMSADQPRRLGVSFDSAINLERPRPRPSTVTASPWSSKT